MITNETVIRVRYKDTDQMGVVYHANYLVWFEVGRTELMRSLQIPYSDFEKHGLYLPVISATCHFKVPARYDDLVTVTTRVAKLQKTRISFQYEVSRGATLLANGSTEHAFLAMGGKPVALPKHSPHLWERLCKVLE